MNAAFNPLQSSVSRLDVLSVEMIFSLLFGFDLVLNSCPGKTPASTCLFLMVLPFVEENTESNCTINKINKK